MKGTPNHPISIKIASERWTNEKGAEMIAWADHLMFETPDFVMVGEKVVDVTKTKAALFRMCMEWGVGTPNKQIKAGGHHTFTMTTKYPLGVDPVAMREVLEQEEVRKGLRKPPAAATGVKAGVAKPVGQRPVSALMKASGVIKAFTDDEGNVLEPVTDQDLGDNPNKPVPGTAGPMPPR